MVKCPSRVGRKRRYKECYRITDGREQKRVKLDNKFHSNFYKDTLSRPIQKKFRFIRNSMTTFKVRGFYFIGV